MTPSGACKARPGMGGISIRLAAFACMLALMAGCHRKDPASGGPPPGPKDLWKQFSGDEAFAYTKAQVDFGPRPSGSATLAKMRDYLMGVLAQAGWDVEQQKFTDETPRGKVDFINLIARFPESAGKPASTATQEAIVCSHYDTKLFDTIRFVGASDGASSTGALLELAKVLAKDPGLAQKIELVFFDGEEAVQDFTETDGLYGSRYYARKLFESGRSKQFKFGILWDMIGKKNVTVTLPEDSPQELAKGILEAAGALDLRKHFTYLDRGMIDDHVPLNVRHIPSIDLIDFDYMYWHTADDTLDKLSPDSLQIVGAVTLYYLQQRLVK